MSIEMHVLFAGKLPSKAKLMRRMKELGFPFSIVPPLGSLETQEGYMPMRFRGDETGVEFDIFEDRESLEDFTDANPDGRFDHSANFRWGGDTTQMLCGMCACAALATLVDGVVVDEFSDAPLSADETIERARKELASLPPPETTRRRDPGTRPADIRRYVKPLLKVRDDLVLIGRHLVIRPVRHLLRGVYFEPTRHKSMFYLQHFIKPLYLSHLGLGFGRRFGAAEWRVYEPYFQAMLETELAQDAFEHVGRVTTLGELGVYLETHWDGRGDSRARVTTSLLCGQRERAAKHVERLKDDRGASDSYYLTIRELLDSFSRDVETFCAQRHAEEANSVKELKLEGIWEPSPFPIELPVAEQRQSAEAFFSTTPWIMQHPSPLMDLPAEAGEVRFAIEVGRREGSLILIAPLTRQEAEERHHRSEKYVLAARLGSGLCFVLKREPSLDRNDPLHRRLLESVPEDRRGRIWLWLALQSSSHLADSSAFTHCDRDRIVRMFWVDVFEWSTKDTAWYRRLVFPDDGIPVEDTPPSEVHGCFAVTAAHRDLVTFPLLAFGEYADIAERLQGALRMTGYGEMT